MKSIMTITSACALLLAATACYGSQKKMFLIQNDTSLPVYVGLYLVGSGKVTNNTSKAFVLQPGQYATFAPQKAYLPGRMQHFIFSGSLDKLTHKVVKHKNDKYVFSGAITPDTMLYKITGDLENMKLETLANKPSGAKSETFYNLKKAFDEAEKERKELAQQKKAASSTTASRGKAPQLEQSSGEFLATAQQLNAETKRKADRSLWQTFKEDALGKKPASPYEI